MSYVETRQILSDIREIMVLLNNAEFKTEKVKTSIGMTQGSGQSSLRRELSAINMYLIGLETWSGNDNLSGFINKMQQLNNSLIRTYMLVNAITAALSLGTPFGWLKVGAQTIGFSISMHNLVQ